MSRALVALLALAAGTACTPAITAPTTFNFERPADVAFVCLRVPVQGSGAIDPNAFAMGFVATPVPLNGCTTIDVNTNYTLRDMDPDPTRPGLFTGQRLFTLVTQSQRGEVAVVNVHPAYDTGPVDNNRTIPGFTFIPVGQFPGALATDPQDGLLTFVANTGDSFITVLDNSTLLVSGEHRLVHNGNVVQINLPAPAYDLALVTRAGHKLLYASVPAMQAVYVIDVTGVANPPGGTGAAPSTPLAVPLVSSSGMRPGGMDGGLPGDGGMAGEGGALDGGGGALPYPTTLDVADDGTVYVADRNSGFLHVLVPSGTSGLIETTPLDTGGVAIRTFAVSPTIGAHAVGMGMLPFGQTEPGIPSIDNKRFIYAASDVDGTVMVLDTTTNSGPLRVNIIADRPECGGGGAPFDPVHCPMLFPTINTTTARFDRLPLLAPANAIGFVAFTGNDQLCEPIDYSVPPGEYCGLLAANAANTPQPAVLRGLQAVIAMRTGQLQIVDVDDPDRNCLGANRTEDDPGGHPRPFQPHIPRFATAFTPLPVLTAAPLLQLLGANITPSPELPSIVPIAACPSTQSTTAACDSSNNWCVCLPSVPNLPGVVDPLAVHDDTWILTYEGVIPGLTVDNGGFVAVAGTDDQFLVQAPGASFCERGTLGPHDGLPGDRVTIPNDSPYVLPMDTNVDGGQVPPPVPAPAQCSSTLHGVSFCQAWFGDSATPCNRELEILDARDDQLTLRVVPDPTHCGPVGETPADLRAAIACCYPQVTQISVRPAGAWTVVGARTGYLHNVVTNSTPPVAPTDPPVGTCVTTPDRYPTGRAYENQLYASPAFTLQIASGVSMNTNGDTVRQPTTRDTALRFVVASGVTPLVLDGGLYPAAIHYVCEDRRMYVVDQGRSSLYEYTISPLSSPRTFN